MLIKHVYLHSVYYCYERYVTFFLSYNSLLIVLYSVNFCISTFYNLLHLYKVSHLLWNLPRQHTTTAPGSELVTKCNCHCMLVYGFQVMWDIVYLYIQFSMSRQNIHENLQSAVRTGSVLIPCGCHNLIK